MHHKIAARRLNVFRVIASYVRTPFQTSSKSSIRGSRSKSKSFTGHVGPRISRAIMKFDSCMHTQGGRLYGTTNTGHMLYFVFFSEKGLKPSVARPSLRFLA